MTDKELKKKATEYAEEQERHCILGVYDDTSDLEYDKGYNEGYINGSEEGYIAGAKENQPTVEEMLKRLLKGGYVKSGIYEKKEHAQQWHIVADGDLPKEKKEYWCKVFYYESEETFNAFLWFDPSTKEFKFLDNIGEGEVSGFDVKEWCEIPEE